ncbi:hypothetical protein DOY81_000385 [Sarcophaga bullata]|nr:hypothetical protein DOY81_000385 [Sarcophaga bullata]
MRLGQGLRSFKEISKTSQLMIELQKNLMDIFVLSDDMLEIKALNIKSELEHIKNTTLKQYDAIESSNQNITSLNLYQNMLDLCESITKVVDKITERSEVTELIKEGVEKTKLEKVKPEKIEENKLEVDSKKAKKEVIKVDKETAEVSEIKAEKLEEKKLEVDSRKTKEEEMDVTKAVAEVSEVKAEKLEEKKLEVDSQKLKRNL